MAAESIVQEREPDIAEVIRRVMADMKRASGELEAPATNGAVPAEQPPVTVAEGAPPQPPPDPDALLAAMTDAQFLDPATGSGLIAIKIFAGKLSTRVFGVNLRDIACNLANLGAQATLQLATADAQKELALMEQNELQRLRGRVAELEAQQRPAETTAAAPQPSDSASSA